MYYEGWGAGGKSLGDFRLTWYYKKNKERGFKAESERGRVNEYVCYVKDEESEIIKYFYVLYNTSQKITKRQKQRLYL